MVLRRRVGRVVLLAAIGSMAASFASPVLLLHPAVANETLVWGGAMPAAGEGYTPSMSAVDMFGTGSTRPAGASAYAEPPQPGRIVPQAAPVIAAPQPQPQPVPAPIRSAAPAPDALARDLAPPAPIRAPLPVAPLPSAAVPAPMPDAGTLFGAVAEPEEPAIDPWNTLKQVTPGALTEEDRLRVAPVVPQPAPKLRREPKREVASLAPVAPPEPRETSRGRGSLTDQTPTGWRNLSHKEALCRAALLDIGVSFTDRAPIADSKNCGIPHPVRVTQIAPGVAMQPAATLNCDAAFRISRWVQKEVQPSARARLGQPVSGIINGSSYRCTRVAGSSGFSQHASGNALDVAAFKLAGGKVIDVERKKPFEGGEKEFQQEVRKSACKWFGTVLGPGYNYDHRHHFHLDARKRDEVFCK